MFERIKTTAVKWRDRALSHHALYGGVSATYGWAGWATGKPEVYAPLAVLYAIMAWRG
ncbi:MAG: hypothetical protein AAF601_15290 [Pseudomonadota bacterium]